MVEPLAVGLHALDRGLARAGERVVSGAAGDVAEAPRILEDARGTRIHRDIGGAGMRDLCRKFQISSVEHITALVALYRPGPMDLIPEFTGDAGLQQKFLVDNPARLYGF